MQKAYWFGRALVAIVLLILVLAALHLHPALGGVMGSILLGIAAVLSSINRNEPQSPVDTADADHPAVPDPTDTDNVPKDSSPDEQESDTDEPTAEE